MLVLGVDPGKRGGITALEAKTGDIVFSEVFPTLAGQLNPKLLHEFLTDTLSANSTPLVRVYCEKVGARPGQAGKAMFTFGTGFGYLEMAFVAMGLSYELVPPHVWAKAMHAGVDQKIRDTKKKSLVAAMRIWPREDFRATSRCRTLHDGLFESALIAEYGRRKLASISR